MTASRKAIIDDTDGRIHYSGQGWFQDQGSQNNVGNFGPTYKKTSHGTNVNGSLSFSFQGTYIALVGTTHQDTDGDPNWECFVDHVSIGRAAPFPFPENNRVLCEKHGLINGLHTMSVNITTAGNTFWVDYLTLTPSPGISFDDSVLVVQGTDPAVKLDSGWGPLGNVANMTNTKGSKATLNFVGIMVTWVGFVPIELPHSPASGLFSVDGGPLISFKLAGLPANSATIYNQAFFTTPELEPGPHSLVVTYNGGVGLATPLTLDYFYITNTSTHQSPSGPVVSAPPTTPQTSSTPFNTGMPSPPMPNTTYTRTISQKFTIVTSSTPPTTVGVGVPGPNSPNRIGAILGGVLGSLVLVALVLYIILWWQRRRCYPGITESRLGLRSDSSFRASGGMAPSTPNYSSTLPTVSASLASQLYDTRNTSLDMSSLYISIYPDTDSKCSSPVSTTNAGITR